MDNNKIKLLSEDTINKIAAGEVVERPASIIKELMENSLDAGATKIKVEIKGSGKTLIRVTDNGTGMSRDDALLSLQRHATSKISDANDLTHVSTLGFRGEALPSIAAVTRMAITTNTKDNVAGTLISIEGGKIIKVKDEGAPSGTIIEAKNLFFNTPARRKFLRTNTTELTNIITTFSHYVLTRIGCEFKLISDGNSLIEVTTKDSLKDRIQILYGKEVSDSLMEVKGKGSNIEVSGYISKPPLSRTNRSGQICFVNRRPIFSRSIQYAIYEGFDTLLPKGRFPFAFLFLEIPSDVIDVNVHPVKREIRFENERIVQDIVRNSIKNALHDCNIVGAGLCAGPPHTYTPSVGSYAPHQDNMFPKVEPAQIRDFAPDTVYDEYFHAIQMNNSYIICETSEGFDVIDQHAAHERILFNKINEEFKNKSIMGQRLLVPITIELSIGDSKILQKYFELIKGLGFSIEDFGKNTFIIDMIPSHMDRVDIEGFVRDVIAELKDLGKVVSQDDINRKIINMMACKAAVKQGDRLDRMEIERLLKDWKKYPDHYTCPHGRPVAIKFTQKELNKKFHRS